LAIKKSASGHLVLFAWIYQYNIVQHRWRGGMRPDADYFFGHRGQFRECFRLTEFEQHGGNYPLVQDNLSRSVGGTLCGWYYQHSRAQDKLVQVISATIFDVAVDIRPASFTYGQWLGCLLNAEHGELIWIPPGLAHGFYVVSDSVDVFYICSDYYHPGDEAAIR
jgi:dTDP-4-dehydrorhamnose 3,5-epimerase